MHRRYWPTALGLLAAAVLGWYLLYTELLVREMQRDAVVQSRIYVQVLRGLTDRRDDAAELTLLNISEDIQRLGVPIVVADPDGIPSYTSNLPFPADLSNPEDQRRTYQYMQDLARRNPPIVEPGLGTVYIGDPPTVQRLRWIPWLQVSA